MRSFLSALMGVIVGALAVSLVSGQTSARTGFFPGTYSSGFASRIADIDSSLYSAALAGLGAGSVSNGTHRYAFTYSDQATTGGHETQQVKFTAAVTVVDNTTNGQVAVLGPGACESNFPYVQVYRDKNGDGVFKFVGSQNFGCVPTFIDNQSDSGLGALIPQTSTAIQLASFAGEQYDAPHSTNDWPVLQVGTVNSLKNFGQPAQVQPPDNPNGTGFPMVITGGTGTGNSTQTGQNLILQGGFIMSDTAAPARNGTVVIASGAVNGATGNISFIAVANLPTCNAHNTGGRDVVNNANATFTAGIGAVVAGGGANVVPVFCDGTNWRIG